MTVEEGLPERYEAPTEPISSEAETKPVYGRVGTPPIERIRHALQQYEALEKERNVGTSFVLLALLITGVSLMIGIPALLDGLSGGVGDDGALELCLGGLFVASVLGVAGGTQATAHGVKLKNAMREVSDAVNYKEEKDAQRLLVRALAVMGGGWLLAQPWSSKPIEPLLGLGVLLFIIGLLMLVPWLVADASINSKGTKKKILDAARSQLRANEDE